MHGTRLVIGNVELARLGVGVGVGSDEVGLERHPAHRHDNRVAHEVALAQARRTERASRAYSHPPAIDDSEGDIGCERAELFELKAAGQRGAFLRIRAYLHAR